MSLPSTDSCSLRLNDVVRQTSPASFGLLEEQAFYDALLAVSIERCHRGTLDAKTLLSLREALSRSLERSRQDLKGQVLNRNERGCYQSRMNELAIIGDFDPRNVNLGRYKTERCRPYEETGNCKYGDKCQFAHGDHELRSLSRHPKYKTELCRTFHTVGFCPYGPRCHFVHRSEGSAPSSQTAAITNGVRGATADSSVGLQGRARRMSESQMYHSPNKTQFSHSMPSASSPVNENGSANMSATTREILCRLIACNNRIDGISTSGMMATGMNNQIEARGQEYGVAGQIMRGCRATSNDAYDMRLAMQSFTQLRLDDNFISGLNLSCEQPVSRFVPASCPIFSVPFGTMNGQYAIRP